MPKQIAWNASKLGTLFGCARAFEYNYIEHIKVPIHIRTAFGAAIHSMLEDFYKKNFKSAESFINKWSFYWWLVCENDSTIIKPEQQSYYNSIRKRYSEVYVHDEKARRYIVNAYKRTGKDILNHFYLRHKSKPKPRDFEKNFNIIWEGFKLTGRMDRIDEFKGGLCISDYKTDKKLPKKDDLLLRKHHQFTIYDRAFKELYNEKLTGIFMYHLRSGKIIPTIRTQKDFDELKQTLEKAESIVLKKDFSPFYGFHCNMCDYLRTCQKREVDSKLIETIDQKEVDLFWGLEDRLN